MLFQDCSQEKTTETLVELININDEAAEKNNNIESPATTSGGSGRGSGRRGQRKHRRCWSQELHTHFLSALKQLGGPHGAFLSFYLKHISSQIFFIRARQN